MWHILTLLLLFAAQSFGDDIKTQRLLETTTEREWNNDNNNNNNNHDDDDDRDRGRSYAANARPQDYGSRDQTWRTQENGYAANRGARSRDQIKRNDDGYEANYGSRDRKWNNGYGSDIAQRDYSSRDQRWRNDAYAAIRGDSRDKSHRWRSKARSYSSSSSDWRSYSSSRSSSDRYRYRSSGKTKQYRGTQGWESRDKRGRWNSGNYQGYKVNDDRKRTRRDDDYRVRYRYSGGADNRGIRWSSSSSSYRGKSSSDLYRRGRYDSDRGRNQGRYHASRRQRRSRDDAYGANKREDNTRSSGEWYK